MPGVCQTRSRFDISLLSQPKAGARQSDQRCVPRGHAGATSELRANRSDRSRKRDNYAVRRETLPMVHAVHLLMSARSRSRTFTCRADATPQSCTAWIITSRFERSLSRPSVGDLADPKDRRNPKSSSTTRIEHQRDEAELPADRRDQRATDETDHGAEHRNHRAATAGDEATHGQDPVEDADQRTRTHPTTVSMRRVTYEHVTCQCRLDGFAIAHQDLRTTSHRRRVGRDPRLATVSTIATFEREAGTCGMQRRSVEVDGLSAEGLCQRGGHSVNRAGV